MTVLKVVRISKEFWSLICGYFSWAFNRRRLHLASYVAPLEANVPGT